MSESAVSAKVPLGFIWRETGSPKRPSEPRPRRTQWREDEKPRLMFEFICCY